MKKQLLLCAGILLMGNLSGCSSHAAKETTDTSGVTNDVSIVSVSEPEDVEGFVTPIASSDFEKDTASEAVAGQDSTDSESVDTPNIEDLWWESIDGGLRILGYEGLQKINLLSFAGCTALKEVRIPESVESIGESAFEGIQGLTMIGAEGSAAEQFAVNQGFEFRVEEM